MGRFITVNGTNVKAVIKWYYLKLYGLIKMKFTVKVDYKAVRKRTPPTGGPMRPKRGKGSYRRKNRDNSQGVE